MESPIYTDASKFVVRSNLMKYRLVIVTELSLYEMLDLSTDSTHLIDLKWPTVWTI